MKLSELPILFTMAINVFDVDDVKDSNNKSVYKGAAGDLPDGIANAYDVQFISQSIDTIDFNTQTLQATINVFVSKSKEADK